MNSEVTSYWSHDFKMYVYGIHIINTHSMCIMSVEGLLGSIPTVYIQHVIKI